MPFAKVGAGGTAEIVVPYYSIIPPVAYEIPKPAFVLRIIRSYQVSPMSS
jgi:hypothetical protein